MTRRWKRGLLVGALTLVLLVGGSRDAYTTEEETRDLFAAAAEPKALWIVDGAAHQDFARFDRAGYEQNVVAFLRRNLAR